MRTKKLFFRTAFTWFQAGTRGNENSKSDETLAIGRDTHIVNCKAIEMISVQYLKS